MTTGLSGGVAASAIMRLAQSQNGFAAVLAKGDPNAGTLLLHMVEKGRFSGIFERQLDGSGQYLWRECGPQNVENKQEIGEYSERRRARDPDLWIIELDVPDATQFIAELSAMG
jgi:hypothetical protein